ncbi:hypothetical protein [Stenotrophomonas oahuensis]|uniref:JmjC domain-containing protein n=1 Tax=Stenotrophomonas oahuensis TaxID=3003271 RepID=A0ABY9YNM0_9GAMM|nr:hypothetical protein [Stenotrophomonas sp. A5586]WNH52461.1 hypothetical protein PDM29_19415 [Stenotrophomonas sp. A5586]
MRKFYFHTPHHAGHAPLDLPQDTIQRMHNGLFRCPLVQAGELMPDLKPLFDNAPVFNPDEWEVDVKVHMLMANQYPCIPNWHCDNVPRGADGEVDYSLTGDEWTVPMLLWVSDGPLTEFLAEPLALSKEPVSHRALAEAIRDHGNPTQPIQPQHWYSMNQRTPHRGTKATEAGWRVFVRLTHRSIAPDRPVLSVMRRHSQVYLDATQFSW